MATFTTQVTERLVSDITLHKLALTTPTMAAEQYEALKLDIEMNGQLDPITLYRGKCVDGRNRWLILQELGIKTILTIDLPNNTTLKDLQSLVKSKELRRHETVAQLAIRAYRMKTAKNSVYSSFSEAATAIGANPKRVSEAKQIVEVYGRADILELLFTGNKLNIGQNGAVFYTDSLLSIIKWLKDYSVINTTTIAPIAPRLELTTDEEILSTQYVNIISKESDLVISTIASRLYNLSKGDNDV